MACLKKAISISPPNAPYRRDLILTPQGALILPSSPANYANPAFTTIITALGPEGRKAPNKSVARTGIGLINRNESGFFSEGFTISATSTTTAKMFEYLKRYHVTEDQMFMLDGGGQSFLINDVGDMEMGNESKHWWPLVFALVKP